MFWGLGTPQGSGDSPGGPGVPLQGAWVRSLVGELRPHTLCSTAKKNWGGGAGGGALPCCNAEDRAIKMADVFPALMQLTCKQMSVT